MMTETTETGYIVSNKMPNTLTDSALVELEFSQGWKDWNLSARTPSSSMKHAVEGLRKIPGGLLVLVVADGEGNHAPVMNENAYWLAIDQVVSKSEKAHFAIATCSVPEVEQFEEQ